MLVRVLAGLLLAVFLWQLFRFAMGLRYAMVTREEARRAEESRGRRVVAEIPLRDDLMLFLEDAESLRWGTNEVRKRDLVGARMLMSGGIVGAVSRDGAALPDPPSASQEEGREHWQILLHLRDGSARLVECGSLREGVSREIAGRIFAAVRAALVEAPRGRGF
jgi:hypothetical protein